MTTLERLENIEKKVGEFEHGLSLLMSLSEKINQNSFLSNDIQSLGGALKQQADMIMTLVHQDRDIQEAVSNLAKTVAAIAEVLESKNVMTSLEFQKKRQANDDKEQRNIIDSLLKMGSIQKQNDPIDPNSLVVLSRSELVSSNPSESHILSDCILIDMTSPVISSELRQDLLGKSIGESVSYIKDKELGIYSILNIKEVYSHQTVNIGGDNSEVENG